MRVENIAAIAGKVEQGKDVVQHMTPAFWNTSWFKCVLRHRRHVG